MKSFCYLGLLYTYLAGHVGRDGSEGAFRALSRGYTHWASGRLEELQVNTNHPEYCHVQCNMKPSMKAGIYRVYILLRREGNLAKICSATCECAAGYVPLPPSLVPSLFLSVTTPVLYVHLFNCSWFYFLTGNQLAALMYLLFFMLCVPLLLLLFKFNLLILPQTWMKVMMIVFQ